MNARAEPTQPTPKRTRGARKAEPVATATSSMDCKVCFDRPIDVLFLPCKHLVCCQTCAAQSRICPVCRGRGRDSACLSGVNCCVVQGLSAKTYSRTTPTRNRVFMLGSCEFFVRGHMCVHADGAVHCVLRMCASEVLAHAHDDCVYTASPNSSLLSFPFRTLMDCHRDPPRLAFGHLDQDGCFEDDALTVDVVAGVSGDELFSVPLTEQKPVLFDLKTRISAALDVPVSDQVLLLSTGQCLRAKRRLSLCFPIDQQLLSSSLGRRVDIVASGMDFGEEGRSGFSARIARKCIIARPAVR